MLRNVANFGLSFLETAPYAWFLVHTYWHAPLRVHVSKCVPKIKHMELFLGMKVRNWQHFSTFRKLQNTITFIIFGVSQNFLYLEVSTARELSFARTFEVTQLVWALVTGVWTYITTLTQQCYTHTYFMLLELFRPTYGNPSPAERTQKPVQTTALGQ